MFELRAQHVSDKEIVQKLNNLGFKTRETKIWNKEHTQQIGIKKGKPLTVKRMQRYVRRPVYAGVVI